jgi:hypothetical protein
MPCTSLDILLLRFRKPIQELGFEASVDGFNEMRKAAIYYLRSMRNNQDSDDFYMRTYKLYTDMIKIEVDINFLEGRYPEY